MNYSSLIFRKDMTGVDEYVKWVGITSDLMKAYLCSQRQYSNGVSYIEYEGELIPEQKILDAFNRFFSFYQKYLSRGYDIGQIDSTDGIYSVGSFQDDYENCDFISTDFSSYATNQPKEQFSMSNGMTVIEVYDNGSIIKDLKSNSIYFYSNEDVNFLRTFKEFPLEPEIVAQINLGLLKSKEKYEFIDGLDSNRLSTNIIKVKNQQSILNQYTRGYSIRKEKLVTERCEFVPIFWYRGKCYTGRHCDNEPEAICETYDLERKISGIDSRYLFNPINFHRNHKNLVEKYVKGEITELGLVRDVLADVAKNPFLILRYNLVDLCRKYCIYINPFKLDADGFMINLSGVKYSALAEQYINGALNTEEIATQSILSN